MRMKAHRGAAGGARPRCGARAAGAARFRRAAASSAPRARAGVGGGGGRRAAGAHRRGGDGGGIEGPAARRVVLPGWQPRPPPAAPLCPRAARAEEAQAPGDRDGLATPPRFFLALPLLPFALSAAALLAPHPAARGLPFLHLFLLLPAVDAAAGRRLHRRFDAAGAARARGFRAALRSVAPALVALTLLGLRAAAKTASPLAAASVGLVLGVGAGGVVFSAAHELLHSSARVDRLLAGFLLSSACYNHWQLSHVEHHLRVGTRADPATARRGEPFYAFFPRCVAGNLADAVRISRRRGSLARGACVAALAPAAWAAAAWLLAGWRGVLSWAVYAFVAVVQLELVNYLEHYGLERHEGERVREEHSWNADGFFLTSATTFNLPYHSQHHRSAALRYEHLRSSATARQLPAPYPAMMLLALFPRAWMRVVDPLLAR